VMRIRLVSWREGTVVVMEVEGKRVSSLDGLNLDSRQQRTDEANDRQRFGGLRVKAAAKIFEWLDRCCRLRMKIDRTVEVDK
jgi:hypothetical protein